MRRPLASVLALALAVTASPAGAQTTDCGIPPGSEPCPAWSTRHAGPGTGADVATGTAVSPDGNLLFVTGASPDSTNDVATIAYDAENGDEVWSVRYDSGGDDQGQGIATSLDGERVFVLARSVGDYVTVAYHPGTGEQLWEARFDGRAGLSDTPIGIAVGPEDRRVYVTGYSDVDNGTSMDYATVAYDQATGKELWASTYDGPAAFWDVVQDIDTGFVFEDGRVRDVVYVTGRSNGASSSNDHTDFATVAYDGASGEELWAARYDGPPGGREYAYALDVSDDGSMVAVTGESTGSATGFDYATVLYDAHSGEELWVARYAAPYDDRPLGVTISPAGDRVYTTGFTLDGQYLIDRSTATVAYDAATGEEAWLARRTGPAGEVGRSVDVSPDGSQIFISGLSGGLVFGVGVNALGLAVGYSGLLAVSYDAEGDERWVAHFGGAATDAFERASALSPDGSRFFQVGGNFGDYLTVAYDA